MNTRNTISADSPDVEPTRMEDLTTLGGRESCLKI
jgi:hypothetical protein